MKLLLTAIFAAASLTAQGPLWIDISGEWRIIHADDVAFAEPGFDDSRRETVTLPSIIAPTYRTPEIRLWLRKTIQLPPGLND